jgi:hypothetical protein
MDIPTGIGLFIILYYTFNQLSAFYGIDTSTTGVYVTFYLFLFVAVLVLPNKYQSFSKS